MSALIGNPLLLTSAPSGDDAYQIEKSLRFEQADSASLTKTFGGTGNRRTWTFATWVKFTGDSNQADLWHARDGSNTPWTTFYLDSDYRLGITWTAGVSSEDFTPNRVYRDYSAWVHVVLAFDTTQSVASDRIKMYTNGVLETEFAGTVYYPTQYQEVPYMNTNVAHTIGGSSSPASFYLADTQFIDGLQLSAAAFGSFDSTGVWNPKAFALPAPNTGVNYSGTASVSGDDNGSSWADWENIFDGDLATQWFAGAASASGSWTQTVTLGSSITSTQAWRFYVYCQGNSSGTIELSSGHIINLSGNTADHWVEIPGAIEVSWIKNSRTATSASSNGFGIKGIEVDGVPLVDSQTDPTTRNNPNNGTTWSSLLTGTIDGSHPAVDAFDGDLSDYQGVPNNGSETTVTFTHTFTDVQSLRVYAGLSGTMPNSTIHNGGSSENFTLTVAGGWTDLTSKVASLSNGFTSIVFKKPSSGYIDLYAIEVNGHILVDSSVDNSFHLKFNDTSSNAALGSSSFDDSGTIKKLDGTTYNTDSSAGTTDGTGLVFAMPGDTLTDIHASINTGSSNKDITTVGTVTNSTSESKLYGSSIDMTEITGDYLHTTNASDDFKFGTGDWTIEFWIKYTDRDTNSPGILQLSDSGTGGEYAGGIYVVADKVSNRIKVQGDVIDLDCTNNSFTDKNGVWTHVAIVGEGGSNGSRKVKVYINGTFNAEDVTDYDIDAATYLTIGKYYSNTDYEIGAYFNDFRIYKGVKKYTANFKPPSPNDFTVNNLTVSDPGAADVDYNSTGNGKVWQTVYEGSGKIESIKADSSHSSSGASYQNWFGVRIDGTHLNESGTEYSEDVTSSTGSYSGSSTPAKLFDGDESTNVDASTGGGWVKWTPDGGHSFNSKIEVLHYPTSGGGLIFTYKLASDAASIDSLTDTPTSYGTDAGAGGEVRGNYCTFNPLSTAGTLSQGNLKIMGNGGYDTAIGTVAANSGKWYAEFEIYGEYNYVGIANASHVIDNERVGNKSNAYGCLYGDFSSSYDFNIYNNASDVATGGTVNTNIHDGTGVAMVAMDIDAKKIWWGLNGTWFASSAGTGNPATGANPHISSHANFTDGFWTWAGSPHNGDSEYVVMNAGQRAFKYTAPSGFKSLCTQNLDDTFDGDEVNNPSKYFDIKTYVGDGVNGRDVGGFNFQPDLIWIKNKETTNGHMFTDAVRGVTNVLFTHLNNAETSEASSVKAFNSDGFEVGDWSNNNTSSENYVSWCWDAGTAASGANDAGSIDISSGNQWKNTTAGFSITKWTVPSSGTDYTVGHGLGAKPDLMMLKNLDATHNWDVYHSSIGANYRFKLNDSSGKEDYTGPWNDVEPTNTVFTTTKGWQNAGNGMIAYCWTAIPGFSAFGSFEGNGSADGPFVYTGFAVKYVLFKNSERTAGWQLIDAVRDPINYAGTPIWPNLNNAQGSRNSANGIDILSNGFKIRNTNNDYNYSGEEIIYAAFAEHPFKTARAR